MTQRISVIFVHGVNTADRDYSISMQQGLEAALPKKLRGLIDYESVHWNSQLRARQVSFLDKLEKTNVIRGYNLRRTIVHALGDATAYSKTSSYLESSYYQIQSNLRDAIERLDKNAGQNQPLVFIGHSLGCHIIHTFIWDTHSVRTAVRDSLDGQVRNFHDYLVSGSAFRRLGTLAGIVTLGCNEMLFKFSLGDERAFPVTRPRRAGESPPFPGASLSPSVLSNSRWLNFYSRNDPLGYPLRSISETYGSEPKLRDYEVASEGVFRRYALWSFPVLLAADAHSGYWSNKTVIRETTKFLRDILTAE